MHGFTWALKQQSCLQCDPRAALGARLGRPKSGTLGSGSSPNATCPVGVVRGFNRIYIPPLSPLSSKRWSYMVHMHVCVTYVRDISANRPLNSLPTFRSKHQSEAGLE